jgi:hypothetical protein
MWLIDLSRSPKQHRGNYNTISGAFALYRNNTGNENTASGYRTLFNNDMGSGNTVSGFERCLPTAQAAIVPLLEPLHSFPTPWEL